MPKKRAQRAAGAARLPFHLKRASRLPAATQAHEAGNNGTNGDRRHELYCALTAQLATSRDVNKLIDVIEKQGWRPIAR